MRPGQCHLPCVESVSGKEGGKIKEREGERDNETERGREITLRAREDRARQTDI